MSYYHNELSFLLIQHEHFSVSSSLLISAVMFHATTGEQTPDSQVYSIIIVLLWRPCRGGKRVGGGATVAVHWGWGRTCDRNSYKRPCRAFRIILTTRLR